MALRQPTLRRMASTSSRSLASRSNGFALTASAPGFFEMRTDHILPGRLTQYLHEEARCAPARRKLFPGWRGMWKTELGGSVHSITGLYHWESFDQRDAARAVAEDSAEYLGKDAGLAAEGLAAEDHASLRETLTSSSALIMVEATAALEACGLPGAAAFEPQVAGPNANPAWELRTWQLKLGYATVPRFLELYTHGLADKLAADEEGASQLATLCYTDCGPLNVVVELWRHESLQSAQVKAPWRKAARWRAVAEDVAAISQSFHTQFMRPLASSPWR